jgi:hypothetical protein
MMNKGKLLLLALIIVAIALFFWLDLARFLSLEALQASQQELSAFVADNQMLAVGGFFLSAASS